MAALHGSMDEGMADIEGSNCSDSTKTLRRRQTFEQGLGEVAIVLIVWTQHYSLISPHNAYVF